MKTKCTPDSKTAIANAIRQRDEHIIRLTLSNLPQLKNRVANIDAAAKSMAPHFSVKEMRDGSLQVIAEDVQGMPVISLQVPGERAKMAEAVEILLNGKYKHWLLPENLWQDSSDKGKPHPELLKDYAEAKSRNDVQAQIQIKNVMATRGIPAPL